MSKLSIALLLVSAFAGGFTGTILPTWLGETTSSSKYIAKILCEKDCYFRTRTVPTGIYLSGGVTMYFRINVGDKLAFARTHKATSNFIEFTVIETYKSITSIRETTLPLTNVILQSEDFGPR